MPLNLLPFTMALYNPNYENQKVTSIIISKNITTYNRKSKNSLVNSWAE